MARAGLSFLSVVSNEELVIQEQNNARSVNEQQAAPVLRGLAAYLRQCWDAAEYAKETIRNSMLKSLRQRNGEYEPEKLASIKQQGGSEIFMMITEVKCRAAESWLRDILMDTGSPPWDIVPSPEPNLPEVEEAAINEALGSKVAEYIQQVQVAPDPLQIEELKELILQERRFMIMREAKNRTEGMKRKISDQFAEGGFTTAFNEFITDLVTFPTAIFKGPIVRRQRKLAWEAGPEGKLEAIVKEVLGPEFERVDPFKLYPEPGISHPDDGYIFEHHPLTRMALADLIGVPGYHDDAIRQILGDGSSSFSWVGASHLTEQELLERKHGTELRPTTIYDALEFWGKISGKMLLEWGMNADEIQEPEREYDANVWLVNDLIIKATLNFDPLGHKPYAVTSFIKSPGAFWGKGIPEIIADVQSVCNAAARALVNNMGIACLTGDTVVYREAQDRKYAAVTLDELWEKKQQHNSGLRRTKLRSLDEDTGKFFGNRVVDIVDNGVADVFEIVTERGYCIKATGTHRFMRDDGEWQYLDDFDVGELIAVNGQVVPLPQECIECGATTALRGVRCRSCASKIHNSTWNQEQSAAATSLDVSGTTARSRYACQSQKKDFCEECGTTGGALEVHHKDRSPWNNAPDNLRTLCIGCHHSLHAHEDSFGDPYTHKYVSYDRIETITFVGLERVFDLCMTAPHHNFIANGFISHNSGPQVEVNIERLPPNEDITQMYPWRIWQTLNDPLGSNAPAIRFEQPDDRSAALMAVYNEFSSLADNHSGIPSYLSGDLNVQGAGRTSSGLSMLMGSAGKSIRQVVMHIDMDIVEPTVNKQFIYNMRYDPDESIKGDSQIIARGAINLAVKDTINTRRIEFLQATANEFDMEIIGKTGRSAILREVAKGLQMPSEEVVPSPDKAAFEKRMAQGEAQASIQPPDGGRTGPGPKTLDQAGNPAGGLNVVSNQNTGRA